MSFQPEGSDWLLSVDVRYGRTSKNARVRNQTNPPTHIGTSKYAQPVNFEASYQDTHAQIANTHEILDFLAGKDVGLGAWGLPGTSVLNFGAQYAAFTTKSDIMIGANPDSAHNPTAVPRYHYHKFDASLDAARSFRGIGPSVSLNASMPVMGGGDQDGFSFDWGANGAVLFGRQKARGRHSTGGGYYCSNRSYAFTGCPVPTANHVVVANHNRPGNNSNNISHYQRTVAFNRSRMVVIPNLGAFFGVSYRYSNAKISFGYRADEFFGAMDGGIDTYKSENRGFFGPYAKISIGLGG